MIRIPDSSRTSREVRKVANSGSRAGASGARNRASTNPHSKVACVFVHHLTRRTTRPCTLRSAMAVIASAVCSSGSTRSMRGCSLPAPCHDHVRCARSFVGKPLGPGAGKRTHNRIILQERQVHWQRGNLGTGEPDRHQPPFTTSPRFAPVSGPIVGAPSWTLRTIWPFLLSVLVVQHIHWG